MAKPIKLTEELKKQALEEFAKTLAGIKMADGKISYNKNFTYKEDEKATIFFTPEAYSKMIALLMSFDSEVAWHGVGERIEGANFLISDLVVYPQTVTGSTVEMDTEAYAKWIMDNIEDERFDHIIMQGHSHVNFGTTPSAVDTNHQESILAQLTDDMYYIFMIWNKKLENNTKIYDLQNNTLYENKDISYGILGDGYDLEAFVEEAKEQVKKKTTVVAGYNYGGKSYGSYNGGYGGYNGSTKPANNTPNTEKDKEKPKVNQHQQGKSNVGSGWKNRGSEDMEDEAYDFFHQNRFDT